MDPRHTDAEDKQFMLNMIAEGGGAQGDGPEQADDPVTELKHHPFRMTLLVNKVLMYISKLYLYSKSYFYLNLYEYYINI